MFSFMISYLQLKLRVFPAIEGWDASQISSGCLILPIYLAIKIYKGAFNDYVDTILPFFLPPPTSTWTCLTLNVDKNRDFLDHLPPLLVHVVIECPQMGKKNYKPQLIMAWVRYI